MITTDACVDEAVSELIELLNSGNYSKEGAVAEVSGDYDVTIPLLNRKFKERTGTTVEAYVSPPAVDWEALTMKAAKQIADNVAARYNMNPSAKARVGRPFTHKGIKYLYVVIDGSQPVWGLKGVNVESGEVIQFAREVWGDILKQVNA